MGHQIEEMLIAAFHNNKNPDNKIFATMEFFDTTTFDDLVVGVDIGYKSFNELPFGEVHNKDLQFSYVENGQRYYVTLFNSMNMHSGSMYYQANFALVIKETTCAENSVFSTLAKYTTTGDLVSHSFGEEKTTAATAQEHGYKYIECSVCGEREITGIVHYASDWKIMKEATATENGLRFKECVHCGQIMEAMEVAYQPTEVLNYEELGGIKFSDDLSNMIYMNKLDKSPRTLEATIRLTKKIDWRAGVIVGNYGKGDSIINLEVYTGGRVRLYSRDGENVNDCIFSTDIRSPEIVHIAVTVDGKTASLYIDGVLTETQTLKHELPEATDHFVIGGDHRWQNPNFFQGTIFGVNLFSDVRSADEIKGDRYLVTSTAEDLVYSSYFSDREGFTFTKDTSTQISLKPLASTPMTLEATLLVPSDISWRGGVVVGNYGNAANSMNLEIYSEGRVRLYYAQNGKITDCVFSTNIHSTQPIHIAVTIEGKMANLYVDGVLKETKKLTYTLTTEMTEGFVVGGDYREGNSRYFQGILYSVNLFSDVRTAEEIAQDMIYVSGDTEGLLYSGTSKKETIDVTNIGAENLIGKTFTKNNMITLDPLSGTPYTFEAILQVPTSYTDRAGAVVSNYGVDANNAISIEIQSGGRVRLFYINAGTRVDCIFDTDIRSATPNHIAVTVDGLSATLYLNGVAVETKAVAVPLPTMTDNFAVGGDFRDENAQYFKGTLYSVNLFDHVRSAEQIKKDISVVAANTKGLLTSLYFDCNGATTINGQAFRQDILGSTTCTFDETPHTFEAVVQLSKKVWDRGGVIVGNYGEKGDIINLEVYYNGQIRFYLNNGGIITSCVFSSDIRSDAPVHIAVTVEGKIATLYIDGVMVQSKSLGQTLGDAKGGYVIGGDGRDNNTQYFKGTIYNVSLFSDARTPEEIAQDARYVANGTEGLLYTGTYARESHAVFTDMQIHTGCRWIQDRAAGEDHNGVVHLVCDTCGKLLTANEVASNVEVLQHYLLPDGTVGLESGSTHKTGALSSAPLTFEALFQLSTSVTDRGGVIIGNYNGGNGQMINIEIYNNGAPRLYYKVGNTGYSYVFNADVRSDSTTHMAITVDGLNAHLYINGEYVETVALTVGMPSSTQNYTIGCDNRTTDQQYFKGTIYNVSLFSDVRTAFEIKCDSIVVTSDVENLIYTQNFYPTTP